MRRILLPVFGISLLLAILVAGHWHAARGFQRHLQAELEQNPLVSLLAYEAGLTQSHFTMKAMGVRWSGSAAHGPVLWRQGKIGVTHVDLKLAEDQAEGSFLAELLRQAPQLRELKAEAHFDYDGDFRFHGNVPAITSSIAGETPLALNFSGMSVVGEGRTEATGMTVTVDSASAGGSLENDQVRLSLDGFSDHSILTFRLAEGPLLLLPPDRLEQQGRLELVRLTPLASTTGQSPAEVSLHQLDLTLLATFDGQDRFAENLQARVGELQVNGQPIGALNYQLQLADLDGSALRRLLAKLAQAQPAEPPTEAELFGLLNDLLRHEAKVQQTLEAKLFDLGDNSWQFQARLAPAENSSLLGRFSAETRLQLADPAAILLTEMYLAKAAAKGETPPTAAAVLNGLSQELGVLVRQADGYLLQVGVNFAADRLTLGTGQSLPLSTLLPGLAMLMGGAEE